MANTTDPLASVVHGTNPQFLIEGIVRQKIYNTKYWKEECFGLSAETLVDKAVQLNHVGGTTGGFDKPTNFLCLVCKMLQISPTKDIVVEYIKAEDFKYVRALGAFYMRLVGRPVDIYTYLEPLYNDFRKLAMRTPNGWQIIRMDEFIDELLHSDMCCNIALPRLPRRDHMEQRGLLKPRVSVLDEELAAELSEGEDDGKEEGGKKTEQKKSEKSEPSPDVNKNLAAVDDRSKNDNQEGPKKRNGRSPSPRRRRSRSRSGERSRRRSHRSSPSRSRSRSSRQRRRRDERSRSRSPARRRRGRSPSPRHRRRSRRSPSYSRSPSRERRYPRSRRRRSYSPSTSPSRSPRRSSRPHRPSRRRRSRSRSSSGSESPSTRHRGRDTETVENEKERSSAKVDPTKILKRMKLKTKSKKTKSSAKEGGAETGADTEVAYWNEQRRKAGLKPLK